MHTYSLSPHPPSLPLSALSLTLALLTTVKQLKHSGSTFMWGVRVGVGGGEVGGGGEGTGGGWRLQRSYWQKAVMNKCVLSLDLKSGRVEEFLRSDGREFQTEGARKLTECSPNIQVLRFGTLKSFSHNERRFRVGSYAHRVWER